MTKEFDYDIVYPCACCGKKTTFYLCGKCAKEKCPHCASTNAAVEAAEKMHDAAQAVLIRQIVPDGISDHDALSELHGIFDGPLGRNYRAALAGRGEVG